VSQQWAPQGPAGSRPAVFPSLLFFFYDKEEEKELPDITWNRMPVARPFFYLLLAMAEPLMRLQVIG